MRNATLLILAVIGLVLSLAVPAEAVVIRRINGGATGVPTPGATLFYDNFETPVGTNNQATAQVGTWTQPGSGMLATTNQWQGPHEGAQFAKWTDGVRYTYANIAGGPVTSGVIQAEWAVFLETGAEAGGRYLFRGTLLGSGGGSDSVVDLADPNGTSIGPPHNIVMEIRTNTRINVDGIFGLGSWHEMFIEVEVGSDQATFGVDGTYTTTTLPAAVASVAQLRFGKAGGNGSFYLDAVPNAIPEPATLGLMGLGGLMLLKRRRSA